MEKFKYFLDQLLSSFWFVPIFIVLIGITSAIGLIYVDSEIDFKHSGITNLLFSDNPASARNVISAIGGAMIGIASTVFSITLVVLQLASSQFGPRLLRNFMYKRLNQVVLGQYVATFVYCLIVGNAISDTDTFNFVPTISIFVIMLVAIFNIILLVIFIHNISVSIQPSKVIDELRVELEKSTTNLFPHDEELNEKSLKPDTIPNLTVSDLIFIKNFGANNSGYVQFFDLSAITNFAQKHKLVFRILHKPGDYVVKNEIIASAYQVKRIPNEDFESADFGSYVTLFKKKTSFQDTEFAIHQIVEIAAKALSPGINDPYTAINCIDNLTSVMCQLVVVEIPGPNIYDDEGNLRIIVKSDTFDGFINAAFNQIRQFGATTPSVLIRLISALTKIKTFDAEDNHTDIIKKHADAVLALAEKSFDSQVDIDDIKTQYEKFIQVCA